MDEGYQQDRLNMMSFCMVDSELLLSYEMETS